MISPRSKIRSASAVGVPFDYAMSIEDLSVVKPVKSIAELMDYSKFSETNCMVLKGKFMLEQKERSLFKSLGKR